MADDGSQLVFHDAPDGSSSVEITWILPGAGMLGRDKRVPRAQGTHPQVRRWGGDGPGEQVVSSADADRLVHELELHQARQAVDGIERDRRREIWIDSLTSRCPHCDAVRALGDVWGTSNIDVHVYQCTHCGSIELFRDGGPIEHPLQGQPPGAGTAAGPRLRKRHENVTRSVRGLSPVSTVAGHPPLLPSQSAVFAKSRWSRQAPAM